MRHIRCAVTCALLSFAVPAAAKPVTMGDISLDAPDSFNVKEIERGVQLKSTDDTMIMFIETYQGKDDAVISEEHNKYWAENGVDAGTDKATTSTKTPDGIDVQTTSFEKATWKGEPTVVRYLDLGPMGPKAEHVLVSLWVDTLAAEKEHDADLTKVLGSLKVNVAQ